MKSKLYRYTDWYDLEYRKSFSKKTTPNSEEKGEEGAKKNKTGPMGVQVRFCQYESGELV